MSLASGKLWKGLTCKSIDSAKKNSIQITEWWRRLFWNPLFLLFPWSENNKFPSNTPFLTSPLVFISFFFHSIPQMPPSCNYNQACTATQTPMQEGTSMYTITSAPAGTHKTHPCRAWKIQEQIKVGMHGCQGTVSHCEHPAARRAWRCTNTHPPPGFGKPCSGMRNSQSPRFLLFLHACGLRMYQGLLTLLQVADKGNASVLSHSVHRHHWRASQRHTRMHKQALSPRWGHIPPLL